VHRPGEGHGASASLHSCNRWLAPPMHFCALVRAAACDEILRVPQAHGLQRGLDFRGWSAAVIQHVLDGLLRPHVLDNSEVSPCMLAHSACALAHLQAHAACVAPYDVRRRLCSTTVTVHADIATSGGGHLEVPVIGQSARRGQLARRTGQGWWPCLLLTVIVFSALVPTPVVGLHDSSRCGVLNAHGCARTRPRARTHE
jgi:hypothetical protein